MIFSVHVAVTMFMTGLIWFVQIVHYPLMNQVSRASYSSFHKSHQRRTGWVVMAPMVVEGVTGIMLAALDRNLLWAINLILLVVIWLSTFVYQMPCHRKLVSGFDEAVHRRLVNSNWIRTVAWSFRSLLVVTAPFTPPTLPGAA